MLVAGIEVKVERKRIKNLHLYVKPPDGAVSISAPIGMADALIADFIHAKAGWIAIQQQKISERPVTPPKLYLTGEAFSLWGKEYSLEVSHGGRYALALADGKAILKARRGSTAAGRAAFVREWYREQLAAEVTRLLPKWQAATDLQCSSWQIKQMTSRWGTCNTVSRKIWLNLQLAEKPPVCLEYIILHELLHLKVRGHNAEFYALMDKYMPAWREVRRSLR